jgi:uncharacterized glyoxalase superfamily protein PhnB
MVVNRSAPRATVVPILVYEDVGKAIDWLCRTFGFTERLRAEHARQSGARIVKSPADMPFGERQYTVEDLGGHRWTFSQSIADVAPEAWGATTSPKRSAER